MAKRVFVIHGWEGSPKEGWFPWLKKRLTAEGFNVSVLAMPHPDRPVIDSWVPFLKRQVGIPDEETFFVGHSIGCQTICRYLETLPKEARIGGAILVAGWVHLTPEATKEEGASEIVKPWLETPIHWENVLVHTKNFAAIFSDDDPFVPLADADIFKRRLGAKIIIGRGKGHFSGSDGITELPAVLDELLRFVS